MGLLDFFPIRNNADNAMNVYKNVNENTISTNSMKISEEINKKLKISSTNDDIDVISIIGSIVYYSVLGYTSYLTYKYISKLLEDTTLLNTAMSRELALKLDRPELEKLLLTANEKRIAKDAIVANADLMTTFDDIGGMKEQLQSVIDNVVLPMQLFKTFKGNSDMVPLPTGVLLYGKPGTGKTFTARALAKECQATFLQINASNLLDKYMGESEKRVSALFSLARKLAPTVIFIDEIDSILSTRSSSEHSQYIQSVQSILLSEWDGLKQGIGNIVQPVVVVGATNRPNSIDSAFLRRMPGNC